MKKTSASESTEKSSYYRPGNRVSFQPSTEFLKHYKSTGVAKQGAATATGIKRAASTSSTFKKNTFLPKSESAVSCSKNDLVSRYLDKSEKKLSHTVNYAKLKVTRNRSTLDLNQKAGLRKPAVNENVFGSSDFIEKMNRNYSASYDDSEASDCSTIGEVKGAFDCAAEGKCKLAKKYSLNVPKNISKSVDSVLSCLPEELHKKVTADSFDKYVLGLTKSNFF